MAGDQEQLEVEYLTPEPMPREFDRSVLARRAAIAIGLLVAGGLVVVLAPGLDEVRDLVGEASAGWLGVAIALEVLSCVSYVAMFRPVFCRRMSRRSAVEIGLAEVAVGSIVPASGAGGVALGAWVLHRSGMPTEIVARRSVAFLLLKSSVNFVAVAVVGVLMFAGAGPDLSPALTVLPAVLAVLAMVAVVALGRSSRRLADSRHRRLKAVATALADGVDEAGTLLRERDPRLIAGATGYWLFDNAVLLVAFHAFGADPALLVVLQAYLIGQLGGALPLPGGIGGIDGGLIGTLVVFGVAAGQAAAAVLLYRIVLFWVPLLLGIPAFVSLRRGLDDERRPDLCLPMAAV